MGSKSKKMPKTLLPAALAGPCSPGGLVERMLEAAQ